MSISVVHIVIITSVTGLKCVVNSNCTVVLQADDSDEQNNVSNLTKQM